MAGGKAGSIALALALALAGDAAMAVTIVDHAAARRATTTAAVKAIDASLEVLAKQKRTDDLARQLDLLAHDRALAGVAREWLLDRGLHALARLSPTPRSSATVQRLTRRPALVYARIDPDHGEHVAPLYDTGATARFVLRMWERRAARDAALLDLAAGRASTVARFAARPATASLDSTRAGIADAFASAELQLLALQRAAIVDAIARGARVDEIALVVAQRLADAALYRLVLGHADEPVALAAVASISTTLDPQTAFDELALAARRADISSAAILAIGRLAKNDAVARRFLLDALHERDLGPSAAAALAAIGDPANAGELGRRLAGAQMELSRRHLVLALKLDRSAAARVELEQFAASRAGSDELQAEVRQWLAN